LGLGLALASGLVLALASGLVLALTVSLPAPQVSGQCANRIRPYHGLATTNNPPKHCRSSRQCERVALALLNAETEAGKQSLLEFAFACKIDITPTGN
jgi:hypothetical protein